MAAAAGLVGTKGTALSLELLVLLLIAAVLVSTVVSTVLCAAAETVVAAGL